jgi:hypothetical protein
MSKPFFALASAWLLLNHRDNALAARKCMDQPTRSK